MEKIIMKYNIEGKNIDMEKGGEEIIVQFLQIQIAFLFISLEDLDSILS
jgi:hypothetical protein